MRQNNFSDIDGFNARPRREIPGLGAAVASVLLGAGLAVAWNVLPYAAALLLVVGP